MHEHKFTTSEKYSDYEICIICGSYHSLSPGSPKELYQDNYYWTYDEKRSKPEEQVLNLQCTDDCGISKVDRMMQFVPEGKRALEIGCFPGVLLQKLIDKGYEAIGIEPAQRWLSFIQQQAPKALLLQGFFPYVTYGIKKETFDCIVGMDVFEHVLDYAGFINQVHKLLTIGGTAVFMSPIILEDGFIRERDFKADEHIWLFTKKFLEPYLQAIFSEVKFTRWIVSHELIILKK